MRGIGELVKGTAVDSIVYASVRDLAEAIRNRQVSSTEVTAAHLARIDEVNPDLNAVVTSVPDRAMAEARAADEAIARGDAVGILHGVPMTIKDNLETAGVISTGGTAGRANFVPPADAAVVRRVRDAGAILMGKTNTPELTLAYESDNAIFGRTNNPYDLERTAGGSSGGAAAIIAAGGSPFDIGSDTGGSLRVPSHFCGTAAIRPTSGRVSRAGHILPPFGAVESLTTIGPMARSIGDVELLLPVISGSDFMDPAIVDMPLLPSSGVDTATLRVAMFTDNNVIPASPVVAAAVEASAAALEDAGARVDSVTPPGIEESFGLFLSLLGADGGAAIGGLLEMYGTTEPHAFIVGLGGLLADFALSSAAEFDALIAQWQMYKVQMLAFMEDYDVIVCPVTPTPAVLHGTTFNDDVLPGFSYTAAFNVTGWPSAVVRAGASDEGLPIGVQCVARPWHESDAIASARIIEMALGGFVAPEIH
jgi:amidase